MPLLLMEIKEIKYVEVSLHGKIRRENVFFIKFAV